MNLQIFKLDVENAEDQIANIPWIIEKAREFQKNSQALHVQCLMATARLQGRPHCELLHCVRGENREGKRLVQAHSTQQ